MPINNSIINQKGTPAFYSDIFANRPTFGYAGRVFISTDTGAIYEDTGTSWTLIADAGGGTTGTLQQVTTNGNTTTLGIVVDGININNGAGTGTSNVAIGSGLQNNTTGSANTSLGLNSLTANTTANNNTAIGNNSLQLNTTGANNTSIGSNSLSANTTASFNTAIGASSLNLNTTGANNTALGNTSLASNTTANNNTAVGSASLQLNTTGANNTAIGSEALAFSTTGANNTALGQQALYKNTTGFSNNAIGISSLFENTTGSNNTGVGIFSLTKNTTGTQNTAIGNYALENNTTATGNTTIGYNSGSAITTGSKNTILGSYQGTTTLTNNIVLSDGDANVRLFSDANGLIGINQAVGSTIGGQLDIHSTQTYALVLNGLSTSNAYTAFSNASVGQWRIGNTYSAGANTFDIFNLGTSSTALSFNKTTNNATFIANVTASSLIKSGGTSAQILAADGSVITAGTNITISGGTIASSGGGSMAIGGSITSATAGSVLFAGTSGVLAQSNAQFFWDNTNSRLGLGTTTLGSKLQVNGNAAIGYSASTAAPTNGLQVAGAIYANIPSTLNNDGFRVYATSTTGTGTQPAYGFYNLAGTRRFSTYIDISQDIYIVGNTSGTGLLVISQSGVVTIGNLAGTGSRAVVADATGVLSAPVSDISVKQNIQSIGYGLNEILKMKPVWFDYIDEYKNFGQTRQNGNIAQEMEAIIPEAVFTTPTTGKMGINYDQLHAIYIKAIQELKAEIDALKNN